MQIETIKIQSAKGRVPYRIIDKANFDPKVHKVFEGEADMASKPELTADEKAAADAKKADEKAAKKAAADAKKS